MHAVVLSLFLTSCATIPHPSDAGTGPKGPPEAGLIEIGHFDEKHLTPVIKKFDALVAAGAEEVFFRINSPGGSIDTGLDFIQHVKDAGVRVKCVVGWKAYSMGFIFLQGACDERLITKRSMLMTHSAWSKIDAATSDSIKDSAEQLNATNETIANIVAPRLHLTKAAYLAKVAHNEWWLSADAALKARAADRLVDEGSLPAVFELDAPEDGLGDLLKYLVP